jgi:hypothetical protein
MNGLREPSVLVDTARIRGSPGRLQEVRLVRMRSEWRPAEVGANEPMVVDARRFPVAGEG